MIILTSITLFTALFNIYQTKNKKDLQTNINTIITINKYNIQTALQNLYKEYQGKEALFYQIHNFAKNQYIKNKSIPLQQLKEKIMSRYILQNINLDIFIINKNYTITQATYKNDIGFNLKEIEDAKKYLDKTKKDAKTYVASNISIDILDSKLNVYSYSKIDTDSYLELGFKFNTNMYQALKKNLETIYKETNNKILLYRVLDTAQNTQYYDNPLLTKSKLNISKKEYYKKLKRFAKNQPTTDKIINAVRFNKILKKQVHNTLSVYIPFLKKSENKYLYYNNFVMVIQIDISAYNQTLADMKHYFVLFGFILLILLLLFYYIIRKNFYNPIMKIFTTLEKEEKITDKTLLKKKDEFGILVEKYNKLFDSLHTQIALNKNLLIENKRFITDTVHQIRTPLTNIMMNGEMVKRFQNDEKLCNFIDQIDASINMLSNSYEDLSYIISSDTIQYKPTNISISALLAKRVKFFTTISKVNFKKITTNIASNIYVNINEIELERIIDNNISNGIKYATPHKPISINLYKNKDYVILEFKTYGETIKNKEKIFDKNYRENESKRGLGLGLNMVKNICQKYGITYMVSYQDGQNIFTFTILYAKI
ncbi:sensor histidine kinase [Sulfurimonas sp.]